MSSKLLRSKLSLVACFAIGGPWLCATLYAQEQHPQEQHPPSQHSEQRPQEQRAPEQRAPERAPEQRPQQRPAPEHGGETRRAPAPAEARPQAVHPQGAAERQHEARMLPPRSVIHGHAGWSHWNHPGFVRPVYDWDWTQVQNVTCVAQDSSGNQYPVTEATTPGFALASMSNVEDDALDRCYAESGQDPSCALVSCSHE